MLPGVLAKAYITDILYTHSLISVTCFTEHSLHSWPHFAKHLHSWPHFAKQWILICSWMEESGSKWKSQGATRYIGDKKLEAGWQENVTAPKLWSFPCNEEDRGERRSNNFILSMGFSLCCIYIIENAMSRILTHFKQLSVTPILTSYCFSNSFNSINTKVLSTLRNKTFCHGYCNFSWCIAVPFRVRNTGLTKHQK